jgi:serine/threonine-protein kinase
VVHRDLKPGNVLLEADGTPKVSDFGLAKLLDTEAEHTHTGTVLGTPAYMAPEQAEGRSRHVGPATDVWALGATLYECLTGRRAFEGRSRAATLELVRRQGPAPPLRWPRGLSRDLEAVCLKCLQKEPAKRYPSAEALAEDLGRWLENKPTQARPLGRAGRALRALARHPRWVTAAALGLLTALGAGAAWALRDPDGPVQRIEAGLARGEAVTLIGEKGGPKWHRWVEGDQEGRVATEPDGTFTVHCSASVALVELVRDPRQARFRLRAEVRHDVSGDGGKVGVYFGRHPCPTAGGPVHHFGALTYNDIRDEVERFHLHFAPNLEPGTPAPPGNKIDLGPHLYARGGGAPWEQTFVGSRGYLTRGGAVKGRWRPLAVVVTPDGVEAVLDGWPVAALAAARWDKLVRGSVASLRDSFPDQPYAQGLDPAYSPGGGLGLYVERSSASFRRVVVEPLDKPN